MEAKADTEENMQFAAFRHHGRVQVLAAGVAISALLAGAGAPRAAECGDLAGKVFGQATIVAATSVSPLARHRDSPLMAFHPRVVWMRFARAARGAYFRHKRPEAPPRHAINWCVWFKRLVAKLALHAAWMKDARQSSTYSNAERVFQPRTGG
jgi:hypothetical protein